MPRKSIALVVVLALTAPLLAYSQELWTSKDGSIRDIDTRAVFVDGRRVYLATKTELYASNGLKNKWESIFFIPSGDNEISCVSSRSGGIIVGTRRGAFRSQDLGKTWRNIFKAIMPEKNIVLAVAMPSGDAGKIMIGTRSGIFVSDNGGARWRDAGSALKNHSVKCIALSKGYIYAGADDGLYLAKDGLYDWRRIFVSSGAAETVELPEEASDFVEEGEGLDPGIDCIALKGSRIYIAALKKISYSDDTGRSWKDFPITGLSGIIRSIAISEHSDKLYCATAKGVFEFATDGNKWSELYRGMDKIVNVRSLVFGGEDEKTLWAGTERGLYRLEITNPVEGQYIDVEKNLKTMKMIFDNEPSFKDLQAAAMKFNEVNPDKIRKWRAEARMRALVPKISLGLDNSKSNTYEIYTSATKDYIIAGPDDISEGFDLSVSWDLADLIWSDDQTNIDVRSRLTTQLRNDILDDLRRAYFERKRLQYELISSPPMDARLRFEKELRIQELTQAIDDITGNQLSENINSREESHNIK